MKNRELIVGIFAAAILTLLYFGFSYLKGTDFFSTSNVFYIKYKNVSELAVSNPVLVNGYAIGRVSKISLLHHEGNKVLVEIEIQGDVPVGKGAKGTLSSALLGSKSILLELGDISKPLSPGDTLAGDLAKGMMDLISEGNLGLIKAAERFDPTNGVKFISYAVWWVKQSILQSLNENARTIRLPVNVVQELHRAKKEVDKGISELDDRLATLPTTINLEQTINEDGDTLLDMIINHNASMPDEGLNTEDMLKDKLLSILNILEEREKIIIEDYFGLTGTPRTLEDIGNDFNLTKERVRQIKEKALRKLRNECSTLFDYL